MSLIYAQTNSIKLAKHNKTTNLGKPKPKKNLLAKVKYQFNFAFNKIKS